jgi:tetratricopeptide (TPR) repeat protein
MQLAASYYRGKSYSKTEEILRKCIEIDNLYVPAYDSLVQLLINQDRMEEAFKLVDDLSKRLIQRREGEKAIPFLKKMLDIMPNRSDFAERLSEIYIDLHQENNAISVLNRLMETLMAEKNYPEAERILRKIMVYEPDNVQYQEKLKFIISLTKPTELKPPKSKEAASKVESRMLETMIDQFEEEVNFKKQIEMPEEIEEMQFESDEKEKELREESSFEDIEIEIEMPEEEKVKEQPTPEKSPEEIEKEAKAIHFDQEEVAPVENEVSAEAEMEDSYNQLEIDEMHEFIREHLIEAEVFNKYGLIDKAVEQLELIINRYPLATEAYLKLKDIYLFINDKERAVQQYIRLIKLFKDKGDKAKINEFIEAAKEISPKNVELLSLIGEPVKQDAFTEVERLEQLYASRKASKEKTKKSVFKNIDELELEIDITRDIEDIASIKEIMEGEPVKEEVSKLKEDKIVSDKEKEAVSKKEAKIEEVPVEIKEELVQEIAKPSEEEVQIPQVSPADLNEIKEEIIKEFQEIDLSIPVSSKEEKIQQEKESKISDLEFEIKQPESISVEKAFDDNVAELKIDESIKQEEEAAEISEYQFSETILNSIDAKLREWDYEGAEEIIQEACSLYGDLPFLVEKQKEIDEMKAKATATVSEKEEAESFGELEENDELSIEALEDVEAKQEKEVVKEKEPEFDKEEAEQLKSEIIPEESFIIEENEEPVDFAVGITEEELDKEALSGLEIQSKKDEVSSTSEMELEEIFSESEQAEHEKKVDNEKMAEEVKEVEEEKISFEPIEAIESEKPKEEKLTEMAEESKFEEEESFFDLAAELENEMMSVTTAVEPEPGEPTSPVSLEDVFTEFKKGVEKQIDVQDYDTRYNLGIAYKEMGLIDEAIAEFQIASKDEKRFLECCSLLGLCFIEKGLPKLAIKWYEKGLSAPGYTEDEYQSLKYELASTYELLGEWQKAYEIYLDVYANNASYRDVAQKIKELEGILKTK